MINIQTRLSRIYSKEKDMVSVSVIIPAYNESRTLQRILGFLEEQDFKDMEVIFVVDERSTDGTAEYVNGMAENAGNLKVILQDGAGRLGEARNIGLEAAAGKYVWFLDADDRPYPDFLRTMHSLAEKHDAEITQCNFIRSSDPETEEPDTECTPLVASGKDALIERAYERVPVTAWSMLIRRDFLLNNNLIFPEGGYAEDVDFIYRAFEKCQRYCYCGKPMYLYLENDNSVCFSKQNERGQGEISVYGGLYDHFRNGDPEFYKIFRRRSALMRVRSASHMDHGNFVTYIKGRECRDMMKTELSDPLTPEYVWLRLSPTTYYIVIKIFLKFIYYRDKRIFGRRSGK